MKKFLSLLFAVIFVIGCASKEKADNPVLAEGKGVMITKEDFMDRLNLLPEWALGRLGNEKGKSEFLDDLIHRELLYKEAVKNRIDKDEKIQRDIEEFTKMTVIRALLEKEIEGKMAVNDEKAREYYDNNQTEFTRGAGIRANHILVDTKAEAESLLKKIHKGESFAELAKKHSKDTVSAQKGGDLGFFTRGRMVPEFENVAFSLKKGEISEPVKSNFGYHIIQLVDKKDGDLHDFDRVKQAIKNRLQAEHGRSLYNAYIDNLMTKSKVKVYTDKLNALTIKGTGRETTTLEPHGQLQTD